jgi:glycosyltransferase involved in cell wall biosynthesis
LEEYAKIYGNNRIYCFWAGLIEDKNYYDSIIAFQHENSMESYCEYLGEVSNIKSILRNTDIVAVCSEMEGFGRVTVESMLAGTIIIGADTGATKEIIRDGENGYLYKNHDVENFVNKLHQIVENQEGALFSAKQGQKSAIEEYSLEHDVEQLIEVYEKCAFRG